MTYTVKNGTWCKDNDKEYYSTTKTGLKAALKAGEITSGTKVVIHEPKYHPGQLIQSLNPNCPEGCFVPDGSAFDMSVYTDLAVIFPDGNLPDMRECVMVCAGQNEHITTHNHDVFSAGEFKDDQAQLVEHDHTITDPGHYHDITDLGHNHTITDLGHTHDITDRGHTHDITDRGHTHNLTDPGHAHSVKDLGHTHDITDPGHYHTFTDDTNAPWPGEGGGEWSGSGSGTGTIHKTDNGVGITTGITIDNATTGIIVNYGSTDIIVNTGETDITIDENETNITIDVNETGIKVNNGETYINVNDSKTDITVNTKGNNNVTRTKQFGVYYYIAF